MHLCILWTLEKGSFIRTVEDGAVGGEGCAKCKGVKALTGQLCWFLTGGSPLHTTSPYLALRSCPPPYFQLLWFGGGAPTLIAPARAAGDHLHLVTSPS